MRLFASIPIPPGLHPSIEKAAQPLHECLGVKPLPRGNYHITLQFIGEADGKKADEIADALSTVKFAPFKVRLFGAGAYPNVHFPRAIYIGGESEGAVALAKKVEEALLSLGVRGDGKAFSVHLTVARSRGAGDISEFLQKTGEVGEFDARTFSLMKSRLLPQGAVYEALRVYNSD
jgi:2'-5' RNA ligase